MTRNIVWTAFVLLFTVMVVPAPAAEKSGSADFDRAFEYHCAGQLRDAIAAYSVVIADCADPLLVKRARFGIASCCFDQKNYEAAITAFLDFAGAYPEDPKGMLAIVYAGNCRMDQERFEDAEALYDRALAVEQHPEDMRVWLGWAHLGKGRLLTKTQRYQEALPYLESAIAEASEIKVTVEAKLFKSECLSAMGAKEDAIQPLDDILSMDTRGPYPNLERAMWQFWAADDRSHILQKVGDYPGAIAGLTQVSKDATNPFALDAQIGIGRITLWSYRRPAEARRLFTEMFGSCESSVRAAELNYQLAYCSYVEKDWASARKAFQTLTTDSAAGLWHAAAMYMVADCCVRLDDYPEARKAFEAVRTSFPQSPEAADAVRRLAAIEGR